uniref:alpha-glucosidase n=1 Tax=Culicoides sonorensis TaxID=179676 RepID=A0A336M3M6_CULSO
MPGSTFGSTHFNYIYEDKINQLSNDHLKNDRSNSETIVMIQSYYCFQFKNMLKHLILSLFLLTLTESKPFVDDGPKQWWQIANFYQLYPRSFKDSDGDGIGDIKGMIANLDHLSDLGITAAWLSPIFASPQRDLGYDVADFYTINPEYGNMTDFENLVKRSHELGIKLMLDFVPNHTSDLHKWFEDSVKKINGKDEYYIWKNGANGPGDDQNPPNNWVSVFGGPAWTYREERKQWYLHQFTKYQPDLNYRNLEVKKEMTNVLKFYLDKGIDGFRLDAINHMYEDIQFRNEPLSNWTNDPNSYDYLLHIYTKDQNDTYDVVYEWREFLDNYTRTNNLTDDKILMTEAYASIEDTMRYYQSSDGKRMGAQMPFNFELIYNLENGTTAPRIKRSIDFWLDNMPSGRTPSWVVGSHDHSRLASRFGTQRAGLANVIMMSLPGTCITYYGEEIAMVDNKDFEIVVDGRDYNRTPMQWDNTTNAGFTNGNSTWLPVHANYKEVNVATAKATPNSIYHQFQELTQLRTSPEWTDGELETKAINDNVLLIVRRFEPLHSYYSVINIGSNNEKVNLAQITNITANVRIAFMMPGSNYTLNELVPADNVMLGKYDAVVLRSSAAIANLSAVFLVFILFKAFIIYI